MTLDLTSHTQNVINKILSFKDRSNKCLPSGIWQVEGYIEISHPILKPDFGLKKPQRTDGGTLTQRKRE